MTQMARITTWGAVLVFLAVSLVSVSATAQEAWDGERYLFLVGEGDRLYQEAVDAGDAVDFDLQDRLLYESLQAKQQALEMLRNAILSGEVVVQTLRDDAIRDLFNLNENVIVLLAQLDQCTAADLLLDRALQDQTLLPEGGEQHLQGLRAEMENCRERLRSESAAENAWTGDAYYALLAEAGIWIQQAENAEDSEEERLYLFEGAQSYSAALENLREAVISERINEPGWDAASEVFDLYDVLVTTLLDMGLCRGAERRLTQALSDTDLLEYDDTARFFARQAEVEGCRLAADEAARLAAIPLEPIDTTIPLPETVDYSIAPYVLWGVAGASAITALTIDLIGADDRDELDSVRAECDTGTCDYDRAQELSNSVNSTKVTVGIMAGVAVVSGLVGLVLFLTSDDGSVDDTPMLTPAVGDDEVGAVFDMRF